MRALLKGDILYVGDKKLFTLLYSGKTLVLPYYREIEGCEYICVMFEKDETSRSFAKEIVAVPRRFQKYESEESLYSIFEDLRLRGHGNKVPNTRPESFGLEG